MNALSPFKWFAGWMRSRRRCPAHACEGEGLSARRRACLLIQACLGIHLGMLDETETMLNGTALEKRDAARLNLLGVICEKRKLWREAKKFYGKAITADPRFAPAQQNLRRWFELMTFGSSSLPILLGDEDPEWWQQRPWSESTDELQPDRTRARLASMERSANDN